MSDNILVESPKTILDEEHVEETLKIALRDGDREIVADLQKEFSLQEQVFDPFFLMVCMDKHPALVAYYSNLLRVTKKRHAKIAQHRRGIEAVLRRAIAKRIVSNREGNVKKPASKDEVDTEFNHAVYVKAVQTYPGLEEFFHIQAEEEQWQDYIDSLEIILNKAKSFGPILRSEARILIAAINNNLIMIPRERKVYEQWPGQYRDRGMTRIGSEEDDGELNL